MRKTQDPKLDETPIVVKGFDYLDAMQAFPRPASFAERDWYQLSRVALDPCRRILWDANEQFTSLFCPGEWGRKGHVGFECRPKTELRMLRAQVPEPELFDWYCLGMTALYVEWRGRYAEFDRLVNSRNPLAAGGKQGAKKS